MLVMTTILMHKIDFFYLDGFFYLGLKEHIYPQKKQFSLKLKGSSVDRLCLAAGHPIFSHLNL